MHTAQHHTTPPPPWPRAADRSDLNPTSSQRAISRLVQATATSLFSKGNKPHTLLRVLCPSEHSNGGQA